METYQVPKKVAKEEDKVTKEQSPDVETKEIKNKKKSYDLKVVKGIEKVRDRREKIIEYYKKNLKYGLSECV